ncbi:MAG TPA: hypothetical protein VMD47_07965 [Candidatus Acidoferrales bacterium]|nr:hypothetical protein [Candidatus Acidoferrales bacterium]
MALVSARPTRQWLSLDQVRASATQLFAALTWAHVPAVAAIALLSHNAWVGPTGMLLCIAIAATVATRTMNDGPALRSLMGAALTMGPVMFGVAGFGNWGFDSHLYFYGVIAMLIAYADWRPIVASAGIAIGYGVLLSVNASATVFPAEGMDRVVLQAIALLTECYVLISIANTTEALFSHIDEFVEFTVKETAEALAGEVSENARLQAELKRLRAAS